MAPQIPKQTIYPLAGNGGAFLVIRLTKPAGYVEIVENIDPAPNGGANPNGGVLQGLQGDLLDPFTGANGLGNAAGAIWLPPPNLGDPGGDYPIQIGDPRHEHGAQKMPLGNGGSGGYVDTRSPVPQALPAGPGYNAPSLGTPLIRLRSNTATATQVTVREWD